jgi:hypothetical protein
MISVWEILLARSTGFRPRREVGALTPYGSKARRSNSSAPWPPGSAPYVFGTTTRTDRLLIPMREHAWNGNGITFDAVCPGG